MARNELAQDAIDVRTERLASQAQPGGTLVSQAQAERTEITQIITTAGVSSITGTANQITASASTGAVTLSTPQSIGTGSTPSFAGIILTASGRLALKVTTPAQITANTNDYALGAGSFHRITTDASRNITGIVAGTDGAMLILRNAGGFDFVLTNQDVLSTAANRIITGTGASVTYTPDDLAILIYDTTTARWVVAI